MNTLHFSTAIKDNMIFIGLDTLGVTQLALHIYEGFLVTMYSSIASTQV